MAIEEVVSQRANRYALGLANRDFLVDSEISSRDPQARAVDSTLTFPSVNGAGSANAAAFRYALWPGTPGCTLPQPPLFLIADPFTRTGQTPPREGIDSFVVT